MGVGRRWPPLSGPLRGRRDHRCGPLAPSRCARGERADRASGAHLNVLRVRQLSRVRREARRAAAR